MLHGNHRTAEQHITDLKNPQRDSSRAANTAAVNESTPRDQSYLSSITEQTKNMLNSGDDDHGQHAAKTTTTTTHGGPVSSTHSADASHFERGPALQDIQTVDPKHSNAKYANYTYKSMVDPVITNKDVEESQRRVKEISRQKRDPVASKDAKHGSGDYAGGGSMGSGSGSAAADVDDRSSGSGSGLLGKLGFGHRKSKSDDAYQGSGAPGETDKTYNIPEDSQYQTYFEEVPGNQQGYQKNAPASGSAVDSRNVNIKSRSQGVDDGGDYSASNTMSNPATGTGFAESRNAYGGDAGYRSKDRTNLSAQQNMRKAEEGDYTQGAGFTTGDNYISKDPYTSKDSYGNKDTYGKYSYVTKDPYGAKDSGFSTTQEQDSQRGALNEDSGYLNKNTEGYGNKTYDSKQYSNEFHSEHNENQGVWSSITNYLGMGSNSEENEDGKNYGYENQMPGGLNIQDREHEGYNGASGAGGAGFSSNAQGGSFEPSLSCPSGASPSENKRRAQQHQMKSQNVVSSQDQDQYYGVTPGGNKTTTSGTRGAYSMLPSEGTRGTNAGTIGAATDSNRHTGNKYVDKKDVTSDLMTDSTPYRMVQNPKNEEYLKSKDSEGLKVNKKIGETAGYDNIQGGAYGTTDDNQQFGQNTASQPQGSKYLSKNQPDVDKSNIAATHGDSKLTDKSGVLLASPSRKGKNDGYYAGTKTKDHKAFSGNISGAGIGSGNTPGYKSGNASGAGYEHSGTGQIPSYSYGGETSQGFASESNKESGRDFKAGPAGTGTAIGSGVTGHHALKSSTNPGLAYSGNDAGINPNQVPGDIESKAKHTSNLSPTSADQNYGEHGSDNYNSGASGYQDYDEHSGSYGNSAFGASDDKGGQFVRDKDGKYDFKNKFASQDATDEKYQGENLDKHKKSENQPLNKIKNLFTKDKKGKKDATEKREVNEHGTVFGGQKSGQRHAEGSNYSGSRNAVSGSEANYDSGQGNKSYDSDAIYAGGSGMEPYGSDANYGSGTGGAANYVGGSSNKAYNSNYSGGSSGNKAYASDPTYASGSGSKAYTSDPSYTSGTGVTGGTRVIYTSDPGYVGGVSGVGNKTPSSGANYGSGSGSGGKTHASAANYASGSGKSNIAGGSKTHSPGSGYNHSSGGKNNATDPNYSLSASNKAFKDAEYANLSGARGKNSEYVGGIAGAGAVGSGAGGANYTTHNTPGAGNMSSNAYQNQQYDESSPNYEEAGQHHRKKSLIDTIKDKL